MIACGHVQGGIARPIRVAFLILLSGSPPGARATSLARDQHLRKADDQMRFYFLPRRKREKVPRKESSARISISTQAAAEGEQVGVFSWMNPRSDC